MSQRQFDQFTDLGHLLSATTDVIIANLVEISFFIFALNRIAFAVDDSVLGHDAILRRIDFDDFELDLSHAGSNCEKIALSDGSVGFAEVGSKEDIEEGAGQAFDGVGDR